MLALKLMPLGDEQGVLLPAELLARLAVQADSTLLAMETPGGVVLLSGDASYEAQKQATRRLMRKHAGVLRELAKS